MEKMVAVALTVMATVFSLTVAADISIAFIEGDHHKPITQELVTSDDNIIEVM